MRALPRQHFSTPAKGRNTHIIVYFFFFFLPMVFFAGGAYTAYRNVKLAALATNGVTDNRV